MSVELQLLLFWILFGGTHMLGSSLPVRTRLIRALGLAGFKGVYSVVALATFTPLILTAWTHRHAGPMVWDRPPWTQHVTELLMLPAFLLVALALATPGPMTTVAELKGKVSSAPRGIQRVTRHPMNAGFGLFGLAHLISNPSLGDWIFWGGWVVYALASAVHQDRRMLSGGPEEYGDYYQRTSLVPFVAILQGRQRLAWGEISWVVVLVAVVLYGGIRALHPALIGGFGA